MGIIKTVTKGICAAITILASIMFVMFVIMTICWGPFGAGADNDKEIDKTVECEYLTITGSGYSQEITLNCNGINKTVECEYLTITGSDNIVVILNDNIKKITITGSGNGIVYPSDANPEVIDKGNNNLLYSIPITIATPVVTETPEIDPDVKESITLIYDGREEYIKCNRLLVTGNANTVIIENDDIEKITILGDGNSVAYPNEANPEVFDRGNYNNVWGSIWI